MQPETQLTKPIRPTKPAGYSYLTRRCDQEERLRVMRYLSGCRSALIEDLGGEQTLSAAKIILIDRLISLLGVIRGIEEYHKENIMASDGSLKSALSKNYLAYVNSCRLILTSLGLERQSKDSTQTVQDIIREFDENEENRRKEESESSSQIPENSSRKSQST